MDKFKVRGGLGDSAVPKTDVKAQDNLYLATNSKWLKDAKIPADRPMIGGFAELDIKVKKILLNDFKKFSTPNASIPSIKNLDKAVNLFKLAFNFDKRNQDGATPIKKDLQKVLSLNNFADFNSHASQLFKAGFDLPFGFGVDIDMKDTNTHCAMFGAADIILPDAGSYKDSSADQLLAVYQHQSEQLLQLAGIDEADSKTLAKNAIEFDKKIAKFKKSQEELNDLTSLYNPYSLDQFTSHFKALDITNFLNSLFQNSPEKIIVLEPKFLEHVEELINSDNFDEVKSWIVVKFINNYAIYLSQEFRKAAFEYEHKVYGAQEMFSPEKHAYNIANEFFGEVIGLYYGQTYFGPKAKANVEQLVRKMLNVFNKRLQNNDWLTSATQKEALKKLQAIKLKIGYPDKIGNVYDQIEISTDKTLYDNVLSAKQTTIKNQLAQLDKKVDRELWGPDAPANLINAFYNPTNNDITFPAAILHAPFYSLDNTLSENLGGIGAVIAHEITHAFDPNGSKFDENGNIRNWWSDEDYAKFNELAQDEIDLFDGIICGGIKTNGKLTVGENVADLGGLTVAVETAKLENGNIKAVFKNWATIWRCKLTDQFRKSIIAFDEHAPQELRANVAAQCIDDFYDAYDIKENDGMWLAPEKRVHIW